MDFASNDPVTPLFINSWSDYFMSKEGAGLIPTLAGRAGASTSWGTANRAMYLPFSIPWPYPVKRVFWGNGSVAGNMDLGIYTMAGKRLFSAGSTAQTPVSDLQYVSLSTPLWLNPGRYYLALNNDGTTNRVLAGAAQGVTFMQLAGALRQAVGAIALPDPMVPAAWTTDAFVPLCGITRTASGF